ncbi:MAG: radical SAM protein [Bacteroidales bacterium]|nr:radical SAM protein [Bacteroidales bacterium]
MKQELQSIVWHVTNRCNLNCKYCSTASSINSDYGLSTKQLLAITKQINLNKIKHVAITGGEPFLRDDLPTIIENIDDVININIDTNGTLLKEKWSDIYNKVHHFSISIDSINDIHDKLRSGLNKSIKTIEWLISKGIKTGTTITVSDENKKSLIETLVFLNNIGVKIVGINRIRKLGRNTGNYTIHHDDELDNIIIDAYNYCNENDIIIKLSGWYSEKIFNKIENPYLPSCYCGFYRATIRHDGYFLPCQLLVYPKEFEIVKNWYKIPNISEADINKLFNESKIFDDFRRATTKIIPKGCSNCGFFNKCNHGCRAESWLNGYNLYGPNINCEISLSNYMKTTTHNTKYSKKQ